MGRYGESWGQTTFIEGWLQCFNTSTIFRLLCSVPGPSFQSFIDSGFQLLLLNARSTCNKVHLICNQIVNERTDLACILRHGWALERVPLYEMHPPAFWMWDQPQLQCRDGDMAVVLHKSLVAPRGPAPDITRLRLSVWSWTKGSAGIAAHLPFSLQYSGVTDYSEIAVSWEGRSPFQGEGGETRDNTTRSWIRDKEIYLR